MEVLHQIFENNIINWLLLVAALVYFWRKYTPPLFEARKERIETAIRDARIAREQGEKFLLEQQEKVANADEEIARISADFQRLATELEQQMKEQTARELVDLQRRIESQIASERQLAITQLRAAAARAAIKLAENSLPTLMTAEAKAKLLSQFMEQLDTAAQQGPKVSAGHLESIH